MAEEDTITPSPGLLNRWDQQQNPAYFEEQRENAIPEETGQPTERMSEQEALERIPKTITMGQVAAARMGEKAIQSIANDALRIDQNGDIVDHQKAVQIFGGDAKQLHDYMYATDPNFRARKDHWMQSDKPLEETQGPIEGGIFAYMLPGTALANSSKSMAGSITYDVAKDAWNSRNNH